MPQDRVPAGSQNLYDGAWQSPCAMGLPYLGSIMLQLLARSPRLQTCDC